MLHLFNVSKATNQHQGSMKAELMEVNNAISMILWTRILLKAQSLEISDNIVYQDNQSAILLENNGQCSTRKKTRHLGIQYVFVTDNIKRRRILVK